MPFDIQCKAKNRAKKSRSGMSGVKGISWIKSGVAGITQAVWGVYVCWYGAIIRKQSSAWKSTLAMLVIDFSVAGRFSLKRKRIGGGTSCTGMVRMRLGLYATD
jgi:hypothetical protein